jgi:hypothetical protein
VGKPAEASNRPIPTKTEESSSSKETRGALTKLVILRFYDKDPTLDLGLMPPTEGLFPNKANLTLGLIQCVMNSA